MKKLLLIIFILHLVLFPFLVLGNEELKVKDVEINLLIPSVVELNKTYSELVLVKNNDDIIGIDDNLTINVTWILSNNETTQIHSQIKRLNYFTKSGFGSLLINESYNYSFCASYTPVDFFDPNSFNNNICKEVFVNQNKTIIFVNNCSTISISSDKLLYFKGSSIKFEIKTDNPYSYWVEDLFGNIVKGVVNSTSSSVKSYTPSFSEKEKSFVLKTTDTHCNLSAEKIVIFREENVSNKNTSINISIPESIDFGKTFYVTVEGYKANTQKSLISIWLEQDEKKLTNEIKTYIENKDAYFEQKIPLTFKESVNYVDNNYLIVLEGLGIRLEKEINVNGAEKEDSNIKNSVETKETKSAGKIKSFYTRKVKFSNIINVYLTLSNQLTDDYLEIHSSVQTIKIVNIKNATLSVEINISRPDEVLIAELKNDFETKDYLFLALNLTKEQEPILEKSNKIINETVKSKNEPLDLKETIIEPVFEKEEKKDANFINYWFFAALTILSIFLFKKNYFYNLIKKTKVFKWLTSFMSHEEN